MTDPNNVGGYKSRSAPGAPPDNYLVWSILATIFCCLPLGIVAIVKSANVNSKWIAGDKAGAYADAESARKFATWSLIAGVVIEVILVFLYFTALASNS